VSFNYLGQFDDASGDRSFRFADEDVGAMQGPDNARAHVIDISAHVHDGRLQLQWFYSGKLHDAETMTALADRYSAALRALIAHCKASEGGLTPSDVTLAQVSWRAISMRMHSRRRGNLPFGDMLCCARPSPARTARRRCR
jgi:non-ribosomal peptide synthase protein (TIGR01720 family)